MTFDRVLAELVRLCESDVDRSMVERYLVVRDLRGRVRVALKPVQGAALRPEVLEQRLTAALGAYLAGPVLSTESGDDAGRLAKALFDRYGRDWPGGWPREYTNVLGAGAAPLSVTSAGAPGTWAGVERVLTKDAWLSAEGPQPPWPLIPGRTPPIFTFHSFKGGVGRTTLVAAYALHLATLGKKVVVIDLDLEAPGIGALFGVTTSRGVLDLLVDHLATGEMDLTDADGVPLIDAAIDANLRVFPAGRIDDGYLQKLARLDYSADQPDGSNPVTVALKALLAKVKASCDVVLLDSRAGLHDLAGISLHGLAHIDVLALRGTHQNLDGLEQTLRVLGRRSDTVAMALVETLLPSRETERHAAHERTRERVYDLLLEHIYPVDDPPQRTDRGEAHDLLAVSRKELLDALDTVDRRVLDALRQDEDIVAVCARLDELAGWEALGPPLDGIEADGGGSAPPPLAGGLG